MKNKATHWIETAVGYLLMFVLGVFIASCLLFENDEVAGLISGLFR